MAKLVQCKSCGHEIDKQAKRCPNCGAKNHQRTPIGLIVLAVIIVIGVIGATGGNGSGGKSNNGGGSSSGQQQQEVITYTSKSCHELVSELKQNATKAADYKGQYLEISGVIYSKDSDGAYIKLSCGDDYCLDCMLYGPQVFMRNNDLKAEMKEIDAGTSVKLRVKITSVGEVLGYSGDLIEIVK